jgi:glycosyltransferase involved in cell wall biosynthesis
MKPLFSIVMASYLGTYPTAASNRDKKILRAIDSLIDQTFENWELLVIADGCEKTYGIIEQKYFGDNRINCILIEKQELWSGGVRNTGIWNAGGEYILYLDIDDFFGNKHLEIIASELEQFGFPEWAWFNDLEGTKTGKFNEKERDIFKKHQHGTCNVTHKTRLGALWPHQGDYAHDFVFCNQLKMLSENFCKLKTPQYHVCHIPKKLDI